MPLRATRAIGTGDGWQSTDSGIPLLDWVDVPDTPPTVAVEIPQRQPIGIDLSDAARAGARAGPSRPAQMRGRQTPQ